ncbi:hypothetical protein [Streptomyces ipomoeae]|uniref:hypothetical protein n=1 Tax=Streptomyces ipomoeae TaxID=103232 RepID=UPI0029BC0965|nr:hypothetical protein [Streptomyces ipomoeae]MDX2698957.1 hypothetical protein [Streptomyces ipomoeae]MDX2844929.1 hypothetical protein [Streptomyces ipomoeae]
MTTRLYAHASAAGAVLCTATACYTARTTWWIAISGVLSVCVLSDFARRCYTQGRREHAVQQRLERLTREDTEPFVPPPPCCSFWRHTDRQVHGPDCTRPPAARITLTPLEEQEFARIVSAFDQAGGAV